jgi:hypothetical protein
MTGDPEQAGARLINTHSYFGPTLTFALRHVRSGFYAGECAVAWLDGSLGHKTDAKRAVDQKPPSLMNDLAWCRKQDSNL